MTNIFAAIASDSTESEVEQRVIVPLLKLLDYSDGDWRSQVSIGKLKADFQVRPQESDLLSPPFLIVEVKSARRKISSSLWQIKRYLRKSSAVFGLLTNGYQFQLVYNYRNQVSTIGEYSQPELIAKFPSFYKFLCKATSLKLDRALYQSQQQTRLAFLNLVQKEFASTSLLPVVAEATISFPIQNHHKSKPMIITVFNNKGGVGKTTTTINLAAALTKLGKRVLLIDIDGQANLTTGLGIDPLADVEELGKKDITHLLKDPRTKLEETIIKKSWEDIELSLVPSHIRLSNMETTLSSIMNVDRILELKLKNHGYDFVLIDPPPSFGKVNIISLMASSAMIIPTQLSAYPIRALEYALDRMADVQQFKDFRILGIAVSMYDQKSSSFNLSMYEKILALIEKKGLAGKVDVFPQNTWVPRLNIISKAQDKGYPIQEVEFDDTLTSSDKEAAARTIECYKKLANHLIKVTQGDV